MASTECVYVRMDKLTLVVQNDAAPHLRALEANSEELQDVPGAETAPLEGDNNWNENRGRWGGGGHGGGGRHWGRNW